MNKINYLYSSEDQSLNIVIPIAKNEYFETRFVRRSDDYFIIYLSSHTGCDQSCRFCHLTATGQTSTKQASLADYLFQADKIFEHYDQLIIEGTHNKAQKVHINFMARGEPLLNDIIANAHKTLFDALRWRAKKRKLEIQFNVSTIFPHNIELENLNVFDDKDTKIYYSLYSLDRSFRKRWIPKGMEPSQVLWWIAKKNYQFAIHWAYIENENDSVDSSNDIINLLQSFNLKPKFNIVRYNPYSEKQGKESDEHIIKLHLDLYKPYTDSSNSRIVPRVGFDVKASCGMFISK